MGQKRNLFYTFELEVLREYKEEMLSMLLDT